MITRNYFNVLYRVIATTCDVLEKFNSIHTKLRILLELSDLKKKLQIKIDKNFITKYWIKKAVNSAIENHFSIIYSILITSKDFLDYQKYKCQNLKI